MKIINTIRTHKKKFVFGVCSVSYGTYWLINRKRNAELLQAYCYEALKYSKEKMKPMQSIKRVTIFLNPIANGESGRFAYDTKVAPLLHLAGLDVRLVRLDKNSEANEYMKALDLTDTDCIVVAGGNATLNECISGLVNRPDSDEFLGKIPFGLIPIGETNRFAKKWFMKLIPKLTDEDETRLLCDSAMSIIRGLTMPADLLRVTLKDAATQSEKEPVDMEDDKDNNDRGAYSLLKENKIYALSNVSAGFVTETDAQESKYWYYGWAKERMNRYFTDRYLRRQPVKFNFSYKLKCHGCSKCLSTEEMKSKLENFINKKSQAANVKLPETDAKVSIFQRLYRSLIGIGNLKGYEKETAEDKEKRLQTIKSLQEMVTRSETHNRDCGRLFETKLVQAQIEANINSDPILENNKENMDESALDTVIVKDVKFNFDDMFLAQKKRLAEFELSKSNVNERGFRFKRPEDNMENTFCVEIDGETYKLDNQPGRERKVRVEHMEKAIRLLRHDPEYSRNIQINFWPRIYRNRKHVGDMPAIQPFENLYIEYSKSEDLVDRLKPLTDKLNW